MKRIFILLFVVVVAIVLSSCDKGAKKIEQPQAHPAPPQEMMPPQTQGMSPKQVSREVIIPDEVKKVWKAVKLSVKNKTTGKEETVEAAVGEKTTLPGSDLTITVEAFLPAFFMDASKITSMSAEPDNPAAKVLIAQGDNALYDSWMFEKMPDVHAFTHDTYEVKLIGGVKR